MLKYFSAAAVAALVAGAAQAAPVNGTGLVTPDMIFGSGNQNGSFAGTASNGVELGLRGKLRYDANGRPQSVYNYDGDRTYSFAPALGNAPANRSVFNWDWSINVSGAEAVLSDFTYRMDIDFDPGAGTDFHSFDPITLAYADHGIGDVATGNGDGAVASDQTDYAQLISDFPLAQNSWNLGFFEPEGFDPQTQGLYTIGLSAFGGQGERLASTSIDIRYGNVPESVSAVPVPAALPLLLGALGMGGAVGLRRRTRG